MEKTFKDRILEKLGSRKPTPWGLSIGLNRGALNRIFNLNVIPKSEHLIKISNALGVSINWLLTGEEAYQNKDANYVGRGETPIVDEKLVDLFHALPEDSKLGLVGMLSTYVSALKDDDVQKAYESFKKSFMKETRKGK
ncbi:MAG: helix-turn-helix domain-containing protein [Deltaproteobacteria bacterium]|nr:helix-turn-helix domain-containing protein [Deltaproteobacteria bacterium]